MGSGSIPDGTVARRSLLAAAVAGGAATVIGPRAAAATQDVEMPEGYEDVDPRTARRVPLTLSLRHGVPIYPGDPPFRFDSAFVDTRTRQHDDGGFLLERITDMGTHTASHISAPVHSSSAASA
jgi:hypothetical protein